MDKKRDNLEEVANEYLTVVKTQGAPTRESLHQAGVTVHLLKPEPAPWVTSHIYQGDSSARITVERRMPGPLEVGITLMTLDGVDIPWPSVTLTGQDGASPLNNPEAVRTDVARMLAAQIAMFENSTTRGFWAEMKSRTSRLVNGASTDDLFEGLRKEVQSQTKR